MATSPIEKNWKTRNFEKRTRIFNDSCCESIVLAVLFLLLTCVYYREVNKAKAAVMAECAAKERLLDELRQRRQERLATDGRANTGKK